MESLTSMLEGLGTGSPGEVRGRSVKVTTKTTTTTRSVSRKNVITKVTVVTETTVVNSMDLPFIPLPGIKTRTSKAVSVLNDHTDILVYDETAFDLTDAEREIIGCIQTPDCSSNFMELTAKLETEVMNYIIQTPEDQDPESVDSRERLIHYQQAIVAIKLDIAESLGKDYYFNYANTFLQNLVTNAVAVFGPSNPLTRQCQSRLSESLTRTNEVKLISPSVLYSKLKSDVIKVLGSTEYSTTVGSFEMESNNLAQFVDAVVDNCPMESFEPAVATIRNILTPGHPIYTSCLKKLAKFYLDIGNYEGAQKLAFEAVKRESCEHGTESTEALYAKIILLKVYLQSMQLYEARSLADSILNAVEVNSIFWFEVMNIKREILLKSDEKNNEEEALVVFEEIAKGSQQTYGDSKDTLSSFVTCTDLAQKLGFIGTAKSYNLKVISILESQNNYQDAIDFMQKLVVNLLNAGQTQDAVMYGEMVYCKSVEWFGENDLRLVQAFKKLEWNFTTAAQLDKVSLILLNVMERKLIQSKAHDVRPLAAPIEHKSEPESADTAFSLLGVKLEFFDYFIDKVCGGVENVQGLSTTEVNIKYLQPLTSESKISLCRLYEKSPLIDKATVFVSHAWKFDFLDVVDALKTHAQNNSLGPDTTFWFDLFSNSQHDTATKPFSFWTGTFMTAIKAIGSVVMIMLPWEDPIPLQRAWCIYELYACMETRSEFNVAMPRAERKRFLSQVNVKSFNKMLASVKSENSTSFLPDDKEKIHTAIRDSIGFTNLDSAMFKVLKEWMLKALKMELQLAESVLGKTNPLSLTLKAGLAGVYGDLGNEEASLLLYQELWDYYKTNVGVDSGFALIHCGNVISSLITLKRFSEAKAPALDLIERSRQIFGNEHQSTCSAKESLAVVLENEAKFAEALALHNDTLQVYLGLYGDESEHTARAKLSLASCYYTMKDFQKASDAYQAAFDTRKRLLGEDHPSTLGTMTSLGSALYLAGRVEESRSLQKECLDKCRRVLGDSHPSTINVANNYAATMDAQDSSSKNDRLELLQLVYSQAIESHGTSSLQIATPLMNLAIEISNTDIQKAVKLAEKAVEIKRTHLGEVQQTLQSMFTLVEMYRLAEQPEKCIETANHVISKLSDILGEEDGLVVDCQLSFATTLTHMDRVNSALSILSPIYIRFKPIGGANFSRCCQILNYAFEKREILKKTNKRYQNQLSPEEIQSAILEVKELLDYGKYEDAVQLGEEILEQSEALNDFPLMVQSKSLMASAYTGCKRYGEAETAHYDLMGALGRMGKTDLNYINSCANALVFFVASKQFDRGVELATETSENIKTLEGETFLKKEILKLCAEIFKNASEFQNYDAMLWRLLEFQPATDPEGIKTLQQIGQNRFDVGLYKEAANLWGPLHYACNDKYGENSLEATSIMKKRGDCYYRMGLIEEAYNFYRQAVERQLKGLGEKDLNYRNSVDDLCAIYVKDGQIKMVLDLIEESIRLESLYGSDLPLSKFQKMRKFATLLMNNGSYDPALNLNIRIVADVREELGNSDMLLVETYQELLEISQQTKNSTDILNFSFAVLETSKETFGDESDKALTALRAYAKCECTHGSFDVGIACYNTVIKVQRRVFGTQHIETLTSLHDMGVQYKIKQMYPEADKALSETLSMAMDTFGPRNELTLNTMSDLAGVLNKMDEKVKAEEYYKTVLEMSVDKYGKEHTKTLGALENLIEFYNINGNEQQASDARANFKN